MVVVNFGNARKTPPSPAYESPKTLLARVLVTNEPAERDMHALRAAIGRNEIALTETIRRNLGPKLVYAGYAETALLHCSCEETSVAFHNHAGEGEV